MQTNFSMFTYTWSHVRAGTIVKKQNGAWLAEPGSFDIETIKNSIRILFIKDPVAEVLIEDLKEMPADPRLRLN